MPDRSSSFGYSLYVGPVPGGGIDRTPEGRTCSGAVLVRNHMHYRCLADTIPMLGAPNGVRAFGRDVRAWVGSPMTDDTAAARAQELAIVFARDERLDPGSIVVKITTAGAAPLYSFLIYADARLTDQTPITMVLGVSAVSVDLIASQGAA